MDHLSFEFGPGRDEAAKAMVAW